MIKVPDANRLSRHMQAHRRELGLQQVHVTSEAVKGIQGKMSKINERGRFFLIRSLFRINSASFKNLSMWGQRKNLTFCVENIRFLVYLCRETVCVVISLFLASPSVPRGVLQWIFSRVWCIETAELNLSKHLHFQALISFTINCRCDQLIYQITAVG